MTDTVRSHSYPVRPLWWTRLVLIAAFGCHLTAAPSFSQPPEASSETPAGVFSETVEVEVINVDVFVTDRSGQPVAGLARDEFELKVDGKIMPISNFYAEAGGIVRATARPTGPSSDSSFVTEDEVAIDPTRRNYVVLLIDHTRLSASNRERAFSALRDAVARLGKQDLIAVVGVEGSLVFYSDFLFDRTAVEKILDDASKISMRTDINAFEQRQIFGELTRGQSGGIQARASLADPNQLISRIRAYAADEYARSLASLRQIETVVATLSGIPGRKSILYLAEGVPTRPGEGLFVEWRNRFGGGNPQAGIGLRRFDFSTDYSREVGRFDVTPAMDQLAATANRAGVTLYAIDAEGDHGGDARSALTEQGATSETLSVIDENFREPLEYSTKATGGRLLRSSGRLTEQLVDLLGDFDTFYSLGFVPPTGWDPGSAHDIKVEVSAKNLSVRHRDAVRIPEPDEREAGALLAALRYQTIDNPLGFLVVPGPRAEPEQGAAALPVRLEIPVGNLDFVPQNGMQAGSLTIYVSTMDEAGNTSRVQKIPFHLNIPDERMEQAQADTAHYPLPLVLRSGDRQVAIGIRDDVSGVFSSFRLDVSDLSRF